MQQVHGPLRGLLHHHEVEPGRDPVGTKAIYYGPVLGPAILSTDVVLDAGDRNTAIGYCNVDLPKGVGACTFWAGSGTLTGFQALVNLTVDSTGLFHWDGAYSLVK